MPIVQCSQCGKKCTTKSALDGKCAKCANSSFAHFQDQLRDSSGSVVGDADLATVAKSPAIDARDQLEIVPLKVFTRAGKRGHYLSCGVVMLEQLYDDVAGSDDQYLNFTHRHAHGGDGDAAATHGDL